MSTKIYTGFRFNISDFATIHATLREYRAAAVAAYDDETSRSMVKLATLYYDLHQVALGGVGKPFDKATEMGRTFLGMSRRYFYDSDIAAGSTVSLLYHRRRWYGMVFSPLDRVECVWFDEFCGPGKHASEYRYWNNTDRPDDVADAEWTRRGKVWDAVLSESWVPADAGYSFRVVEPHRVPDHAGVRLPTLKERVSEVSKILYMYYRTGHGDPAARDFDSAAEAARVVRPMLVGRVTLKDLETVPD